MTGWASTRTRPGRVAGVLAVLAAALLFGAPPSGAAPRSVTVALIAGQNAANGGFNFNGYAHGGMVLTVPVGWKVIVSFENASVLSHSAIVLPYASPQPPAPPATPAFAGAATPNLAGGLSQHQKVTFSFAAGKPGTYEFACGVPGHAVSGMWEKLVVSASAKAPSITPGGAAKLAVQ